jgi:WD repeat-containing protein 76
MASPPGAGLTEYERRREENIRRNDAILASLRREAAELSASFRAPSPKRPRRQPPQPRSTSPVVLRRSLRSRGLPPSNSSDAGAPSSPATPPSPPKPRTTRFSSSLAASLRASAAAVGDASASATEDGFDAGKELVLRPADVRRVVPERILSVRILPLADRTVVAAGNKVGHIGLWDVDGVVEDEDDGDGADGVFEYFPHSGPVAVIVAHPAEPRKVMNFFAVLHLYFICEHL